MFVPSPRRVLSGLAAGGLAVATIFGSAPALAAPDQSSTPAPEVVTETPSPSDEDSTSTEPTTPPAGGPDEPTDPTAPASVPPLDVSEDPTAGANASDATGTPVQTPTETPTGADADDATEPSPEELVEPVTSPFRDVPVERTFFEEIVWLADSGISTGWADGTFRPGQPVLRDSMAAFLNRFAGSPAWGTDASLSLFRDVVPGGLVFYPEITWLSATGITTGWPDGTFGPFGTVARDQMAAFLYRLAGSPSYTVPVASPFRDVATSHVFYKEIAWLASTGITEGWDDGTFRPFDPVLRDQMAAFLYRFDQQFSPRVTATPPTSNVVCGSLPNGGCFQVVDSRVAYSAGSGSSLHFVGGAIGVRWEALGRWNSGLGYPTSAEHCGLVDGGCVQSFQGGDIYWTPATGAHAVWRGTAITAYWLNQGAESGSLGYPVTEEACSGTTCEQHFQNGVVEWSPTSGARLKARTYTGTPVEIGQAMAADHGWTGSQWTCLYNLWQKESNWNPLAMNRSSGAYGIPQSLPGSKMATHGDDWRTNPVTQIAWGIDYITGRYGTACGAWNHSQAKNWY